MARRTPATWNWQSDDWGAFRHDAAALMPALAVARRAQGEVLGLAKALGMEEARNAEALIWTSESLATAAIEGEQLNIEGVRSSIAKRMGLPGGKATRVRAVEGLLDMMQDAATGWNRRQVLQSEGRSRLSGSDRETKLADDQPQQRMAPGWQRLPSRGLSSRHRAQTQR